MKLPRVRFTVRRLMVAVAVLGILLGGVVGMALFIGPRRIPSVFDHEGVARVVGDLANRSSE
jgi:hypothetical protein